MVPVNKRGIIWGNDGGGFPLQKAAIMFVCPGSSSSPSPIPTRLAHRTLPAKEHIIISRNIVAGRTASQNDGQIFPPVPFDNQSTELHSGSETVRGWSDPRLQIQGMPPGSPPINFFYQDRGSSGKAWLPYRWYIRKHCLWCYSTKSQQIIR